MRRLNELFPEFAWAVGADVFLEEFHSERLPLIEQLRRRKIIRTEIAPLLFPGGLKIEKQRFVVVFNEQSSLEEKIETLGHEIGHTFHYDLTSNGLSLLCPEALESEEVFDRVEEFCTVFAQRWSQFNLIEQIPEIIGD